MPYYTQSKLFEKSYLWNVLFNELWWNVLCLSTVLIISQKGYNWILQTSEWSICYHIATWYNAKFLHKVCIVFGSVSMSHLWMRLRSNKLWSTYLPVCSSHFQVNSCEHISQVKSKYLHMSIVIEVTVIMNNFPKQIQKDLITCGKYQKFNVPSHKA